MDNEQFFVQRGEIYLVDKGKARHITGETKSKAMELFRKIAGDLKLPTNWEYRHFVDGHEMPPMGKPITEWPEEESERPQRKMSILWMGDDKWSEYGGTHVVGFLERVKPDWYTHSSVKLIMYMKTDDIDRIRGEVEKWKGHPNYGGIWLISGHEPDITGNNPTIEENRKLRIAQYKAIREVDPDAWNHPVVIFYDMTSCEGWDYPGWEKAFPMPEEGVDCDIFVADCYANNDDGTVDYRGMAAGKRLVDIGLARSEGQFIPNLGACYHPTEGKPASLVDQYNWWKKELPDISAVAFWNSGLGCEYTGIYQNECLAEQAKEVNRMLGLM